MRRTKGVGLSEQVRNHAHQEQSRRESRYKGPVISTGSTLLDLAISGGCRHGGGLPGGIFVEIFGPASCGKTVILCEIAGAIQRQGGEVLFYDPEARLNKGFARLFGLNTKIMTYKRPDTVPEVFQPIRKWAPADPDKVNGIIGDSLAALSTDMEMEDKDKMGMRRAKEFSEELRKTCRVITKKNYLMVCSNQVRENVNAGMYEQKFRTPGGIAIGYYASLQLRCHSPQKIKRVKTLANGKQMTRIVGVETVVDVYKSSIWEPFHTAIVPIIFSYGIDDIRANLQFLKSSTKGKIYQVSGQKLSKSLEHSCQIVEHEDLQNTLREEVIELWEDIESKFVQERKPKR